MCEVEPEKSEGNGMDCAEINTVEKLPWILNTLDLPNRNKRYSNLA